MSTSNIFDTLAQHDTQLAQHDQMVTQAAQPNIFDQMAANNGQLPEQTKQTGPQLVRTPAASDIPTFGYEYQKPEERLSMPLVKGLVALHDKLREMENLTPEGRAAHPIQGHIGDLANRIEGLLIGNPEHKEVAIGTGQYGMLTNPALVATTMPEAGESAINAVREGISSLRAARTGEEAPGIIKQVLRGREVAQEPAKVAIRGIVGAKPEAAMLEGHESVADEMLSSLQKQKAAAYEKVDRAAGFDVKETRQTLKDAQYKIKQPEIDEAAKGRLQEKITEMQQRLGEAEKKVGPEDLKTADTLNQKWRAAKDFRRVLVQATSEDGETVNIDRLLNSVKKLRNDPKFGDRLEQLAGKQGADNFVEELRKAKELGSQALDKQRVATLVGKWVAGGLVGGGAAAAGYELLH